jgi:hypothetical protein
MLTDVSREMLAFLFNTEMKFKVNNERRNKTVGRKDTGAASTSATSVRIFENAIS